MSRSVLRGIQMACGVLALVGVMAPSPAEAQIRRVGGSSDSKQAIGFNIGYFVVKGEDSRNADDVLFNDLDSLLFDIKDFNGATIGAEWLVGLTDYIEVGAGINYYQRTVPSIYRSIQFEEDGTELDVDLKMRQIPMMATVRFLPVGRRASVQPYIGAGIAAIRWRYTETGEFLDFDGNIFRDSFEAKGTEVGPVILGGVRFPVSDQWLAGGEFRWHSAKGDTGGIDEGFLGDKIDLGGWSTNFTIHFRF